MKKTLALLISVILTFGLCVNSSAAAKTYYLDVNEDHWAYDSIIWSGNNYIMFGTDIMEFSPGANMTRAMLVTVLWRGNQYPDTSGRSPFKDVTQAWYKNAVAWAYESNIVNGKSATLFAPDESITRQDTAVILYRYAAYRGKSYAVNTNVLNSYPDSSKVQPYARTAMAWAVQNGLINGINGKLEPGGKTTRAQITTLLYRLDSKLNIRMGGMSDSIDKAEAREYAAAYFDMPNYESTVDGYRLVLTEGQGPIQGNGGQFYLFYVKANVGGNYSTWGQVYVNIYSRYCTESIK